METSLSEIQPVAWKLYFSKRFFGNYYNQALISTNVDTVTGVYKEFI